MAKLKTTPTDRSVKKFLDGVTPAAKRDDAFTVLDLMRRVTKMKPKMWGSSIVGFGTYHYKYESGREGDWFLTGFSPRKQALTLYIMDGFDEYPALLRRLGKHKTGKSCLYISKLEDVDLEVLTELVRKSVQFMKRR